MRKALKPVVKTSGQPKKDLKAPRGPAATMQDVRLTRPAMPMDMQDLPNTAPLIGQRNPKHINMMFAFGKQSFEGTVGYGPLGKSVPGKHCQETERTIIKNLGKGYKQG